MVTSSPLFANSNKKVVIIKGEDEPSPVAAPKSLFSSGIQRKRIEVSESELQKYSENAESISEARNIIIRTNVDDLRFDYVLDIGKEYQEQHAELIAIILDLSNDITLSKTKEIMSDLLELLKTSPIEKKWFGRSIDINEVTLKATAYADMLKKQIDPLTKLIRNIDKTKGIIDTLVKKIEPYVITVAFFSEYKKDNFPADLFISRLSSLMSTRSTLATNNQQMDILRNGVTHYCDAINNIVLTELPIWVTNCVTTKISKNTSDNLDTDRENLIDKIQKEIKNI